MSSVFLGFCFVFPLPVVIQLPFAQNIIKMFPFLLSKFFFLFVSLFCWGGRRWDLHDVSLRIGATIVVRCGQSLLIAWNQITHISGLHTIHDIPPPSLKPWIPILSFAIDGRIQIFVFSYIDMFIRRQVDHRQLGMINPHSSYG